MPNWCDCKLTITGPNRQVILDKIKSDNPYIEDRVEYTVPFDIEKIVPRPKDLGDKWQEWGYENWGCKWVSDMQYLDVLDDAHVVGFYTPWTPPDIAVRKLATIFPENTFLLEHWGDNIPWRAQAFRSNKGSHYYELPDFNRNTCRQATLYEIFCAVLKRTGDVQKALDEVERVKTQRLASIEVPEPDNSDPNLNALVEALFDPYEYDMQTMPADEQQISGLLADESESAKLVSEKLANN